MDVGGHLRPPGVQGRHPLTGFLLGVGKPVAIGIKEVVPGAVLHPLPAGEVVGPVHRRRIGHPADVLVVDRGEGVAAVRVEHRVDEDHGVAEHFHRGGVVTRGEVLEELEDPLGARELEAVNRATVPGNHWLIADDRIGVGGRGATRVGEPEGVLADLLQAGMVLGGRHHRHHQIAPLPALAHAHQGDAWRRRGQPLEVGHRLVVLGDPLAEVVAGHFTKGGNRSLGGGGNGQQGKREQETKQPHDRFLEVWGNLRNLARGEGGG